MRNKKAKICDPNEFVTSPGVRLQVNYRPSVLSDGSVELVEDGKVDVQDFIDSFRDQTDMAYIVNRLMMGDTSVLTQKQPMFGDFTKMPQSYAEALQMVLDAEQQFNSLPLEVRNSFENDYKRWFASAGNEDWFEKMKPVLPDQKVESEVVVDES